MTAPIPLLLVDDDDSSILTLSALLEDEGFEVTMATSTREARAAVVSRGVFSAALVDRNLDGEDGIALALELRGCSSAIFILSGDPPESERLAGIDGWFLKGTPFAEVVQRIRETLLGAQRRRA